MDYVQRRRKSVAADRVDEDLWIPNGSDQETGQQSPAASVDLFAADRLGHGRVNRCSPLYLVRTRGHAAQGQRSGPGRRQFDDGQPHQRRNRASQLHLRPHRRPRRILHRVADLQLVRRVGRPDPHPGEPQLQVVVLPQVQEGRPSWIFSPLHRKISFNYPNYCL